jgi:hypothetical protein
MAPTSEHSPSPFSGIDDEVEDFQSTLVSEMTSNVPQCEYNTPLRLLLTIYLLSVSDQHARYAHVVGLDPRSLEIDQWSPQSSEDEYHESHFPISPDFDSYFEELLDPQLNGSPEAESWPDDLTPDWLLDISFNLLRPFKRSFALGRYDNTARKLGNHYFAHSNMQSTLGHAGKSVSPTYECSNFDFFGEQSGQIGCGPFPVIPGPGFGSGNSEYGNFVVRNNHSRRGNSQTRRMIWPYPGQNKLQRDEILTGSKICCNGGRIISTCTSCGAQPAR